MSIAVSRNNGLELLRFGAALSVLYGHLIWSATFATDISTIVGAVKLPLIPEDTHVIWQFQNVYGFLTRGGNITAVGIAIFFLITGWLTPDLMERYKPKAYLINRFFRIMPLLVFATLLSAVIVIAMGGTMPVTWLGLIGTSTTLYREIGVTVLLPVVWTLAIEIKFYLLSFAIGKWNIRKLIYTTFGCLIAYFLSIYVGGSLLILAHDLHFILFILVGIGLRFAVNQRVAIPIVFTMISFNLSRINYALLAIQPHQDFNISNQVIAIVIFLICLYNSNRISNHIRTWAKLTYSIYLLHLVPGLGLICLLRDYTSPTIAVCFATTIIFFLALFSYRYIESPFIMLGKKLATW